MFKMLGTEPSLGGWCPGSCRVGTPLPGLLLSPKNTVFRKISWWMGLCAAAPDVEDEGSAAPGTGDLVIAPIEFVTEQLQHRLHAGA